MRYIRIASTLALTLQGTVLIGADFWTSKKPAEWSESEARKILSQSPWARRAKLRSSADAPASLPQPGVAIPRAGIGVGGTVLSPSAQEIYQPPASPFDDSIAGPGVSKPIPCLGWGAGAVFGKSGATELGSSSPTSDECKAAWGSVSAAKSAGLSEGSVIVLWESAAPIREAKVRRAIDDPVNTQVAGSFVISLIGYPLLVNAEAGSMKRLIMNSAVLLRKGRDPVEASNVAVIETNGTMIRFFFPRQDAIHNGDRELTFRFKMGSDLVEATFSFKDMIYAGGPAL